MKPEAIHAIIGLALVGVFLAIIAGVGYLLYGPALSFPQFGSSDEIPPGASVFTCPDTVVTALFAGDTAHVELADGRTADVTKTPIAPGTNVEESAWERYEAPGQPFIFWHRGNSALIQEGSVVTHGECLLQSQ